MKRLLSLALSTILLLTGCTIEDYSEPANSDISYDWDIIRFDTEDMGGYVRYCGIVKVVNTGDSNINLGYWKLDIEDSDGHLVHTEDSSNNFSAPTIIKPGETGYYFTGYYSEFNSTSATEYNLVPHFDYIRATSENPIEFAIDDLSFNQSETDFPMALGRVVNNTDEGCTYEVYSILYDESGDIISIAATLDEVGANDTSSFRIEDNKAYGRTDIASYEVKAFKFD